MMIITTILAAVIAGITIEAGISAVKNKKQGNIKKAILTTVAPFSTLIVMALAFIIFDGDVLATNEVVATVAGVSVGEGFKYIAAALSTGMATIGTGRAVGAVGSAAIGAVSEDPSILGKTLIFVGMAEGIAIYGMIISILILFA
ncbi:ATP synthase subunit C [Candidatus Epulonipiscium viviparus]|uniref:ATP synthase subunit C n=1 Tax=Candidatus Epulonipiscium viviparus TaxID=420336 RepID=UPI000495DE8E|nr:ATP synthase subunit C [Candidatus Epulopiscium viviparus]